MENTAGTDEPDGERYPRLLGARIAGAPPIVEVFVDLSPGLVVAYGRNGAGKTRMLTGVEEALTGLTTAGERDLVYEWLAPTSHLSDKAKKLPGNPWISELVDAEGDPRTITGERPGEVDELHEIFQEHCGLATDAPVTNYATNIAMSNHFFEADDREPVAVACAEIAAQGLFKVRRTLDLGGNPSTELLTGGIATSSAQALMEIWNDVRREFLAWLEEKAVEPSIGAVNTMTYESIRRSVASYGYLAFDLESVAANVMGVDRPLWFADSFGGTDWSGRSAPCALLIERREIDIERKTLEAIERRLGRSELTAPTMTSRLLVLEGDKFSVNPDVSAIVSQLTQQASRLFSMLMEDAPPLKCRVTDPRSWPTEPAVSWVAADPSGSEIRIGDLSRAQLRWASFAIRLTIASHRAGWPLVILLDEPESALHRRAERFLVEGLEALINEFGATAVIATHSPAFLGLPDARLVHVRRDQSGATQLVSMPHDLRERIDDLGLEPSDLLQNCKTIVLVEGQHELTMFSELFADELAKAGALVFAMRGLRNLKNASDAQLMFGYTSASLLVVVDNEVADRVSDVWARSVAAVEDGRDPLPVVGELGKGRKGEEATFLREFMTLALHHSERDRIRFHAMSMADITEYLDPRALAPRLPKGESWQVLRDRHERSAKGLDFKKWMTREYGADYEDASLVRAVQALDHLHPDLTDLLAAIRSGRDGRQVAR